VPRQRIAKRPPQIALKSPESSTKGRGSRKRPARRHAPSPPRLEPTRTDEELFGDFRAVAARCRTCRGTRALVWARGRWVSTPDGRAAGAKRCPSCKAEQERVFNYWLDRVPSDGKRSWRTRIHSFVVKNHKGFQQVVGSTVSEEDIEQDVLLAVWMVWDRYYDPNYKSQKTGRPVKLCTYVWRAIQTAWAKVTERCFCVRNTVHMVRKEDAGSEEHQPIYDPDAMRAALAKLAKVEGSGRKMDEIVRRCRTPQDKRPFTPAMLAELVAEADQICDGSMLSRLALAIPKVAKKKRNAVPAHMMMKSLDASAGSEDDASKNSELVSEVDHRLASQDAVSLELAAQVRAIASRALDPVDQHVLFGCVAGGESIRSVATQYHMTVAEVKARVASVRRWLEDAKQDGVFDGLLE